LGKKLATHHTNPARQPAIIPHTRPVTTQPSTSSNRSLPANTHEIRRAPFATCSIGVALAALQRAHIVGDKSQGKLKLLLPTTTQQDTQSSAMNPVRATRSVCRRVAIQGRPGQISRRTYAAETAPPHPPSSPPNPNSTGQASPPPPPPPPKEPSRVVRHTSFLP